VVAILLGLYVTAEKIPTELKTKKGDPNPSSKFTGRGTLWPSKKEVTDNVRCLSLDEL
jgi:hypothetical protein